jgi:heme-degrading monooxygenase HmoA
LGDAVLHIRLIRIAADSPALDDCVAYIESEGRQAVEFRPGSLGISVLADRTEGAALFGSVWASWEAMSASEETEAPLRAELARRAGTPITAEDYQIPISVIFDHAVLLLGGQAVRLTRIQVKPSQVDDVIEVVGDEVVPSLSEAPGFRAALLFADPASGRMISETIWRDPRARAAAPSVAAIIRREFPDEAGSDIPGFLDEGGAEICGVADYSLVFSSIRDP